jgi:hypothetical protein
VRSDGRSRVTALRQSKFQIIHYRKSKPLDPNLPTTHHTQMRLLALALTLTSIPVAAQNLNALLEETTIHSGTAAQFESAQKDYCAAVVKGGAPACLVFSTATFGQSDRYFTVLPFASFIHYDQGKYTDKGLTPDEAKVLSARRVPPIAGNHESAILLHRDLSILPTVSNADYPLNLFMEYRVSPGYTPVFLEAVRKVLLPAARKANLLEFEVFTTTVGESPDRILIVTRLKNFAELDQPNPIEAVINSYRFQFPFSPNAIQHEDTWIMRYRADLSTDPRTNPKPQQ